jgi:geranylgeranyl reductase family protein
MISEFDVIISGAGPAGCTAALALGASGLKVALIEKDTFPREKVCGDAVPAYVPKVLNTINPDYSRTFEGLIEKNKINVCRIVAPGKKVLDLKFSEYGYICKRIVFDSFLFELTDHLPDLTVLQNTAVKDVTVTNNEVIIFTDKNINLKAQLVIGCDGASSIVRKRLSDNKNITGEGSVAVRAYFKNVKDNPPGTLEFHFLKDFLPGYFWIFPLPENQFNVGLGMPSKIISEKKINLRNEITRIIDTDPTLNHRFSEAEMTSEIKGHFLPLLSRENPISGNRFLICGDAASLINPATGGGIGQAMQSGKYAGWHAVKCFEKNDFSGDFMKGYDKTVYDRIWKENRRYLKLREYVFKYPYIFNAIISTGLKSKSIHNIILKILE